MPDFLDQLFQDAEQQNQGRFLDESRDLPLDVVASVPAKQQKQQPKPKPQQQSGRVAGQNVQQRTIPGLALPSLDGALQGVGKWIEENASIPIVDMVDNVFQGNQKTPDQIAVERKQQRAAGVQQDQRITEQLRKDPLGEPVRVVGGALRGAAESALNTAEIIGDTNKWLYTLGNVKQDQNPFSSKYEWASWDLGKDDAGAQTGVGKVAQGFLEFAALAAATGGFGGMAGAGAKVAAASTNVGKAGIIAQAGARGGISGIAADMMSATRGEGNLSNLIKENAPEWYPTFLTALAVDEDDSPWEAMLKTGFEGFGLGAAADAVGAYIGGVRATRQALKSGASEEAAGAAGEQVFKETLDAAQPLSSVTSTQPLQAEQFVQQLEEVKASDPSKYWSVDSVDAETVAKSKVITVEGGYGLVTPDGEIKGVFALPGSNKPGDRIIQQAVREGGVKLDNFETPKLREFYERNNFVTVGRTPFNAEFAPSGWDEARHGRPDVVAMIYDPHGVIDKNVTTGDLAKRFNSYDDLIEFRDYLLREYPELLPIKQQLLNGNYAKSLTTLPNGAQVTWSIRADTDITPGYGLPDGTPAFNIQWGVDSGTEFGTYGRRVMTDFNRIAREQLPPGSVLVNYPAGDDYGLRGASEAQARRALSSRTTITPEMEEAGFNAFREYSPSRTRETWDSLDPELRTGYILGTNGVSYSTSNTSVRARLYERAGFGPTTDDGIQASVVRSSPDGRGRWLQPLDLNNPDEARRLIGAQGTFLDRAGRQVGTLYDTDFINRTAEAYNTNWFDDAGYTLENFQADYGPNVTPWSSASDSFREQVLASDAAKLGPSPLQQRLEALQQQSQQGLPITWDDVANVVPERFTPGAVPFERFYQRFENDLRLINNRSDGYNALLNPRTGDEVSYFAVRIDDNAVLNDFTPEGIDAFAAQHADVLSRDDALLRASWNKELNAPEIQLVRGVSTEDEARFLGDLFDQTEYIFVNGRTRPLLGGESLEGTTGGHLSSQFGVPMESRTVDSTTAIQQQMQARTASVGSASGGSQRTVTTAQLRRIARATGDAPAQMLRQMVRENPVNVEELSRVSRQTVDEVVNEAAQGIQDALGVAGEVDFSKILRRGDEGDELLSRAGIVQVRGLMQEVTTRLYESGYAVMKLGEANMDTFPQVQRMADELKSLMRIHKESANAYSKYLSAYKIKVPVLGIEISNPVKVLSDEELAKEIKNADKVLDKLVKDLASGDPQARAEAFRLSAALVLAEGDPSKMPSLWKYIREIATGNGLDIMYNSMLSSPKTQEINLISNAMNTIYRPIAAATGGDAQVRKAAIASFYGFHKTLGESFKMAAVAMKDGPINGGSKVVEQAAEATEKLKLLQRTAEVSDDKGFQAAVGFISFLKDVAEFPAFAWPSKLLTSSDEFFKTMIGRMEYNSQTMMQAISESANTSDPLKETFERMLKADLDKNFDPKTGAILNEDLLSVAKEVTFQTDLDGPMKAFGDMINQLPVMRIFFPFVKTGHNIMVYAGTHVPVLNRALSEYKAIMNGTDEYAKAVYKGREAYGRMLVLTGGLAAFNGILIGNGPPDPQERKLWLQNNQPRSINLTKLSLGKIQGEKGKDKFMDISKIEPFGQILTAVADLAAMTTAGQLSEDRAQYLAGYLTYAVAMNFTNKSYMQGVVPLGQALTPGWQGIQTLASMPVEIANNFIPLSGARRTFANLMSPYMQEFNGTLERLAFSASGGLIKTGATQYDFITGEPVPSVSGGPNALLPFSSTDRGGNKVKDALERIEFDSSVVLKTLSGVKLTPQQRSDLQKMMGESSLQNELKAWVSNKNFWPAVEEFQQRLRNGERIYKENQPFYSEIVRIITDHRDTAIDQLKTKYPDLDNQILQNRASRTADRQGRPDEVPLSRNTTIEALSNMPY
jgi:hypothetical protein